MGIINETEQRNDPRYEATAIPDATNLPQPSGTNSQAPVEQLPSLPSQPAEGGLEGEVDESLTGEDPLNVDQEPGAIGSQEPDVSIEAYRRKPLDPSDFIPLDTDETNSVFPSITDITNKYQQQESERFNNELNKANQAFQNTALSGASYPSYYEVLFDRRRLNQLQEQQDSFLIKPQEELLDKAYDDAFRAIPLTDSPEIDLRTYDFGSDRPSLNSMRDVEDNTVGLFGSYWRNFAKAAVGFGEDDERFPGYQNPETPGTEFAPARGIRLWWDNFTENPLGTLGSMVVSPGSPFLTGAKFGDYPGGLIGALTYSFDMIQNIPMAIATDIHRMSTGEFDEGEDTSVMQALRGRDYNFSSPQDPEDNDKPFSVLNLHDEAPTTWKEVRERSWIWRFPGGIVTYPGEWLFGEELPDIFQDKKRLFQINEFIAGIGLDIAVGGGLDNLARAGVNWRRIQGIDNVRRVDDAAKRAVSSEIDPVTGMPVDPNDADNLWNATRRAAQATDEPIDEVTGLSRRVPGMITQSGEQARAGARLEDLTVDAPPSLSQLRKGEVPLRRFAFSKQDTVFDTVTDKNVVDAPDITYGFTKGDPIFRTADDLEIEQVAKTPTGIIEEATSQQIKTNVPARQAVDDAVTLPHAVEIEPPKYDFPSTRIDADGTTRLLTPLNDVPTNPLEFKYLDADDFDAVRRSNSELTELARSQSLVPPSREVPLSSTRLSHLNDLNDGLLSRYGRRLDDVIYQVPETTPEVHRALRISDDFADNVLNAPVIKSDTIKYQRALLPSELHGATGNTLRRVSALAKTANVYDNLASETAELAVKLSQEKQILNEAIQRLDDIPDVGRRTLLANPEIPRPTRALAQPLEGVSEEAAQLAKEINAKTYYHGSKANLDLTAIDPVQGAARSELGIGIHFTSDQPLAIEYAAAKTTRNLPPVPARQIDARGYVYQVKPKVSNPIDAKAPLPPTVKDQLASAINDSELPPLAKTNLKRRLGSKKESLSKFFNDIDDVVGRVFTENNLDYPEQAVLDLQRRVTQNLRSNLNVDSILYRSDIKGQTFDQLTVLGTPDSFEVPNVTPSVKDTTSLHQAIARSNVDATAAEMFPHSKYAQVNAAESKVDFITQATQRTADQYDDVAKQARVSADEMVEQQRKLRAKVKSEKAEIRARKEAQWSKQNDTQLQHWNLPEEGLC